MVSHKVRISEMEDRIGRIAASLTGSENSRVRVSSDNGKIYCEFHGSLEGQPLSNLLNAIKVGLSSVEKSLEERGMKIDEATIIKLYSNGFVLEIDTVEAEED